MTIDFTLAPEHEEIRDRVRTFVDEVVRPTEVRIAEERLEETDREAYRSALVGLRKQAFAEGLWLPHMPKEWGGMGLGHVELAMVQAEAAKTRLGPWVLNCQAPDEGNMHTLLHWATDEQKEQYLRPLCDGRAWSCFAMTEPEVAGSDPTLIRTHGVQGRRRVGDQRPQVVHLQRPPGQVRHPHRPHRGRPRHAPGAPTRPSSSTCPRRAGTTSARSRPCTAPRGHSEIVIEDLRVPTARSSAVAATATASASTASARPAWPTACAGSPRPRRRST